MQIGRRYFLLAAGAALAACGPKFRSYDGPEVTLIEVHKAARRMYLLHNGEVLKSYRIHLGGNPIGHKQFEGDGKTPEGAYLISYKNPRSTYHLSLKISYPNAADRAFAKSQGKKPGGDIFIHGASNEWFAGPDWTAGCIAVSDREMEEIYAMINPGTQINIYP